MALEIQRVFLVTDFGEGIYLGQMRGALHAALPAIPVFDLVHDLAPFRPDLAAYLLPAVMRDMPAGSLYLCVVDPGVGGARHGLLVETDRAVLIGPDNGLFAPLTRGRDSARVSRIGWQPDGMAPTFHGRDWFVPAAIRWIRGDALALTRIARGSMVGADWPDESARVLYVDRFGNLMTGLRAEGRPRASMLHAGGRSLSHARTFSDVQPGEPFWYGNALGLIEIAVNQGRADRILGISAGEAIGPFAPVA